MPVIGWGIVETSLKNPSGDSLTFAGQVEDIEVFGARMVRVRVPGAAPGSVSGDHVLAVGQFLHLQAMPEEAVRRVLGLPEARRSPPAAGEPGPTGSNGPPPSAEGANGPAGPDSPSE